MAVRILTDSTCDMDPEYAEKHGVTVFPMSVFFGDEHFRDGVDLTREEFYRRLEEGPVLPKTSQITPAFFEEQFREAREAGDTVVCILISSKLSGNYQSALIGRNLAGGEGIYVVDSLTVTGGLWLLVHIAVKLRDKGMSAREIATYLESVRPRMRFYATLETLKYLKLGGRISGAAAVVGTMLGIRPVISVVDGEVRSVGKVRSQSAGRAWILEKMRRHRPDPAWDMVYTYSKYSELAEDLMEEFIPLFPTEEQLKCNIGSVVGTYAGPGAVGVMYIEAAQPPGAAG